MTGKVEKTFLFDVFFLINRDPNMLLCIPKAIRECKCKYMVVYFFNFFNFLVF